MDPVVASLSSHVQDMDAGGVVGLYVFGSSVLGGLHPDSDIDLLLLTRRSLSSEERRSLLDFLLAFSGRRATRRPGRPLELTGVVVDDVVPWRYPPVCDFLYGEWLRKSFGDETLPDRHVNPDLAVVITTAREHSVYLVGLPPADVLPRVPDEDLHAAMRDSVAPLLDDLVGDERNVLLTLARMVVTLDTGRIVPKNEAAALIIPTLREQPAETLDLARRGYLGEVVDDWHGRNEAAAHLADQLVRRISRHPIDR